MVEQQDADLVMLVAHGRSGGGRWPYGSVATSFIAYGTTSLMIMQDLSAMRSIKQWLKSPRVNPNDIEHAQYCSAC